jgi:hypothetical protein
MVNPTQARYTIDGVVLRHGFRPVRIAAPDTGTDHHGAASRVIPLPDFGPKDFGGGSLGVRMDCGAASADKLRFDASVMARSGGDGLSDAGETVAAGSSARSSFPAMA